MSFGSEFKEFIARGNAVDLAVGVIIGAAFGKIVTSLVDQIIMPPVGLATGGVDFAQMKLVLKPYVEGSDSVEFQPPRLEGSGVKFTKNVAG